MAEKHISPIAVDLGAKHTGVFLAHYPSGTDPAEGLRSGQLITAPDGGKQWSQNERTANRHQRRGYKRAKLAKRLLHVILTEVLKLDLAHSMGPNQTAGQWFDGLLNNRGYTYLSDDIDKDLLGRTTHSILHDCFPQFFRAGVPLLRLVQEFSNDLDGCKQVLQVLDKGPRDFFKDPQIKERLAADYPGKDGREEQQALYSEMRQALERIDKAKGEGHHRRQNYLDNIRTDIKNHPELSALCKGTMLTADALANLVGHVSNLQLRVLRKYFNDPSMAGGHDRWDESRMGDPKKGFFWRYILGWRPDTDEQKKYKRELLARCDEPILKIWQEADPKLSVPPFEDQNNHRPPRCQSLLLDPVQLDRALPAWKTITRSLIARHPDMAADLEEKEVVPWPIKKPVGHPWKGSDNFLARALQRFLDRTGKHDPYRLRLLASFSDEEKLSQNAQEGRANLEADIGTQHIKLFIAFAARYYEEVRDARDGSRGDSKDDALLIRCDLHPPLKRKQQELLLGAILGTQIPSAGAFMGFLRGEKIRGNNTLGGVCKRAAEAQKKYGNSLKAVYQRNDWLRKRGDKPEDKDVLTVFDLARKTAAAIARHLGRPPEAAEKYASPFSLAQIYNILEGDVGGFSSTCKHCSRENAWRSRVHTGSVAMASRLAADSIRPFDGVLARLLDTQAREIAKLKLGQIREAGGPGSGLRIPIVIEENRFEFSAGMKTIRMEYADKRARGKLAKQRDEQNAKDTTEYWRTKFDRIKDASGGVCPYSGVTLGQHGDFDHIVPQSLTRRRESTAYNSEANLIYVTTGANTAKGNRVYDLDDLSAKYLKKRFGTDDLAAIEHSIDTSARPLLDRDRSYTSFADLNDEEQKCLRHALFIPALRAKAIDLLATQAKTRVNGTQRWFARRIMEHLSSGLHREFGNGINVNFDVLRVNAEDVYAARTLLAAHDKMYTKQQPQPIASHALDACMAFVAALYEPAHDDVLTWPMSGERGELGQHVQWITGLIPTDFPISTLSRVPKYRKPAIHGQPLFLDSVYGERFVPLMLDRKGRLHVGFALDNALIIERDEDRWFELLQPFLAYRGQEVTGSVTDWQNRARSADDKYLYFTVGKTRAFEHLHRVAKKTCDDTALQQADLLDGLSYVVLKQNLTKYLTKNNGKEFKTKNEVLDQKSFELKLDFSGRALPRGFFRPKGKPLTLPAMADWERIVNSESLKYRLGKEVAKDFNWRKELESLFPSNRTGKQHQAVRKVYSLPTRPLALPGRLFRIRRRLSTGEYVWQSVAADGYAAGLYVQPDGSLDGIAPLTQLWNSPSVTPRGARFDGDPLPVCPFDEWRAIMFDRTHYSWLDGVEYAPGNSHGFFVRVRLPFVEFMKRIVPFTDVMVSSPLDIPGEMKLTDIAGFKKKYGDLLGQARSKLRLIHCGDVITFWYEGDKETAAMRKRYEEATSKKKE